LGAFSVIMAILAIKRSNEGTVIAFTIVGQLTLSIVIDHFGWLDVPQTRISANRIIGVGLLALGAFLIHRK
jgi:bacterial/archaeal transporter family-2 protein